MVFEINAAGMPYEEGDLALVVNALDVNLSVNLSVARIRNNLVVLRTLIIMKLNVSDDATETDTLFSESLSYEIVLI